MQKKSSRTGDRGRRALTLNEISFLDQWQVEPTEQELADEDDAITKVQDDLPKHVAITLSPPRRSPKLEVKKLPKDTMTRGSSAPDLTMSTQMRPQSKPWSRPQSRSQSRPQSRQFDTTNLLKGTLDSMQTVGPDDLSSAKAEFMSSTLPQFPRLDAFMDKQVRPQTKTLLKKVSLKKVSKIRLRCEGNKVLNTPDAILVDT